jgi:hypothetical protein
MFHTYGAEGADLREREAPVLLPGVYFAHYVSGVDTDIAQ